jgi:predicted ATPase
VPNNNWYVITGGPSTGKTTLLSELEKLGHLTVPEAARIVIEEATKKGVSLKELRKDERMFQTEVLKLKQKLEEDTKAGVITFFDRGMQDSLAYMRYYGFAVEEWMQDLFTTSRYQKIFLLEPLSNYVKDYARTEPEEFVKQIHEHLRAAYQDSDMKPLLVPEDTVKNRLQFILKHINVQEKA